MQHDLQERTAVITGAGGMIGAAVAHLFASRGAHLVAVERPGADWSRLEGLVCERVEGDVTVEADMARVRDEALRPTGQVDILFNNAGIEGSQADLADYPVDSFERVMAINVTGVFIGLKTFMPLFQRQGRGSIINSSSIAGIVGAEKMAGYIASKHAVVGLTKVAALEGAPHGVRTNAVHPGFIESRMLSDIAERLGTETGDLAHAVPMGRLGTVDEVAEVVGFLASDASSYMNGSSIVVDGGVVVA